MKISSEDREILASLEAELWREVTRFDNLRMQEMIAPDFWEIGRSGRVYQRADTLSVPRQPLDVVMPLPDFQVRLLASDIAQVTYQSVVTVAGAIEYARRSSIWSRTARGWVLRFHQGTPFYP